MMKTHIDTDTLTNYSYKSLNDASREGIDAHLLECPRCRERLQEIETHHRGVKRELQAALNRINPSDGMTFAGIADRLAPPHPLLSLQQKFAGISPVAFALTGLSLALVGLWQLIQFQTWSIPASEIGALPTLACFFFMLASVDEMDKVFSFRPRFAAIALVAVVLWLGTAFIGMLNIIVIRDLSIMAVVALGGIAAEAGPVAILAVMGATVLFIAAVIGGGEYHFRNIGQPSSWKLFTITLLVQLFILILPYLVL